MSQYVYIAAFYTASTPITSFIGLRDAVGDSRLSSYTWTVDNTTMSYENFYPGEPGSTPERCVAMVSARDLKWHRWSCDTNAFGLCEIILVS